MNPVLGRLTDEILLRTARSRVTFDRLAFRPDEVVQFGELDNKGIIVIFEERLRIEAGREDGLKMPASFFLEDVSFSPKTKKKRDREREKKKTYIMLFDNLLKSRIIQLCELGQIMHISDDVTQHLLEEPKVLIGRSASARTDGAPSPRRVRGPIETGHHARNLLLAGLDAADDLLALDFLEVEDLVELALEQTHKVLLVVFRPGLAVGCGAFGGRVGDIFRFESLFEVVVGDVVPVEFLDYGGAEVFAESGGTKVV